MSPRFAGAHPGGLAFAKLAANCYVARTPRATLRFYWRGLWRALRPIPMDRPLPRPLRDF